MQATLRAILLASFTYAVAIQAQQFPLAIPLRAVASDGATPVTNTWIAAEGGLFRSGEGNSWRNVYLRPAGQIQPVINQILVEPKNPAVFYLSCDLEDGGVWKSTDGGLTWATAAAGLPRAGSVELFQFANAPRTLYARAANQIFRSTDGAVTWTPRATMPGGALLLSVHPTDPSIMYAARNNAIYRTRDEGANWTLTQPLSLTLQSFITSVLVDRADPSIVHVAVAGPKDSRAGFYRSANNGERFDIVVSSPLDFFTPLRLVSDAAGRFVFAESGDPGRIYRTTDKGFTWEVLGNNVFGPGRTVLSLDPNDPRIILAGTSGGLAESTDGGIRWQRRVGTARPTVSAPAHALSFVLPSGVKGRLQLALAVVETTQWTLPVSITAAGGPWLSVTGASVNTPTTPTIEVDTANLEPGEYTGTVRVDAPASGNGPLTLPVKLNVVFPPSASLSHRIATVAGSGVRGNFGDNGPALRASFLDLDSVAVDRDGNIFLSDPAFNVVRRISANGIITRYAGSSIRGDSGDGGAASIAQMNSPTGIAVDAAGVLYICDSANGKIRKVTADGNIVTLASGVGPCRGIAVDAIGFVYVTVPPAHVVLRISQTGQIAVYAGQPGAGGFRGDGGAPADARLNAPLDVSFDPSGRLLIADTGNHRIRRVENGIITTIAGSGAPGYQGEGPDALLVAFGSPSAVAGDAAGNVYVSDADNHRIRHIAPNGAVSVLAGTGTRGFSGDSGPGNRAQIAAPSDVAVEASGSVLSVEGGNYRLRRLTAPAAVARPEIAPPLTNFIDGSTRLSPGTIFRLRGAELSLAEAVRDDTPWPGELGGARVTLNGEALPLMRASATEVIGLIPSTAPLGGATIVALRDGVPSADRALSLEPAAPAILTNGDGRALAGNEDGSANWSGNPARAGSFVSVYFTGSGAVENPPVGGAGAGDTSRLTLPVSVQLGEALVEPEFARLAPGRAGVAEVRFRIPEGIMAGDHPVVVRVGDAASAPLAVAVGEPPPAQ